MIDLSRVQLVGRSVVKLPDTSPISTWLLRFGEKTNPVDHPAAATLTNSPKGTKASRCPRACVLRPASFALRPETPRAFRSAAGRAEGQSEVDEMQIGAV